ncbi:hypothetical protein ABMY26_33840 [Azospirillum sp. HJ39]|uniref:hypothetical protein n=1 Tax=Azospirillum sp. HJ39 TaxID=3159496 RepID=UPI0035591807
MGSATTRYALACAMLGFLAFMQPAAAGERRFAAEWDKGAQADLTKMMRLHKWSDEVINKTLARYAMYLSLRRSTDGQEMVVDGIKGATISVGIDDKPIRSMPGCIVASMVLKNPLRTRTSVDGVFCSKNGTTWTYAAAYLEISEVDVNNNTITVTDVTDIGKKRPE